MSEATSRRPRVVPTVMALLIGTLIVQVEINVVGPAMPTIGAELADLSLYPWVFAGYFVAYTATVPFAGMINDVLGRRAAYLTALVLAAGGSLVCGRAESMEMLIVGRLIQGAAGGSLFVTAQTILGDMFTMEVRARLQSAVGLVAAVGAAIGPALGGWFVTYSSWRWAFFAVLPVAAVTTGLFLYGFADTMKRGTHAVNWRGSILLTAVLGALLAGIGKGGFNPLLIAIAVALAVPFFVLERSAARPVLPPDLFANNAFRLAAATLFFIGWLQIAYISYLQLYLQDVVGLSPATSGYLQSLPITVMVTASAFFVGTLIKRRGYRFVLRIGAAGGLFATVASAGAAWHYSAHGGSLVAAGLLELGQASLGVCLGVATTAAIICVQNQVVQTRRGTATASLHLIRGIGGTVAPAILGVALLAAMPPHLGLTPEQVLGPKALAASGLDAAQLVTARAALGVAFERVLAIQIGVGALAFVMSLLFPRAVVDVPGGS
ncbi:MAG TPA: MFS transporter [Kofleriaceae bacterium]|nr:MFS transporter [Kofleriaceae bacterium]